LTGQRLDASVRENGGEGIGHVEIARALAADLENDGDVKIAKAIRREPVATERAEIVERRRRIRHDRRPQRGRAQCVDLLARDEESVAKERRREVVPLARLRQTLEPREDIAPDDGRQAGS
jgi:hypothetical protein